MKPILSIVIFCLITAACQAQIRPASRRYYENKPTIKFERTAQMILYNSFGGSARGMSVLPSTNHRHIKYLDASCKASICASVYVLAGDFKDWKYMDKRAKRRTIFNAVFYTAIGAASHYGTWRLATSPQGY